MHSPFEKWRLENIPQIGFTADIRELLALAFEGGRKSLEQPKNGIECEWYCKGWDDAEKDLATQPCCNYENADAIKWNEYNKAVQCHNCGQVYAIPPSREWVGLSDWDYVEIYGHANLVDWRVVRAIEAKLKEKNG